MHKPIGTAAAALAGLLTLTAAGKASAASVVNVGLWDKMNGAMATDLAYGTPNLDLSKAMMGIKLSEASAPTGVISFKVTNGSRDLVHEMVILRLAQPGKPLPYDAGQMKVDEKKSGYRGEVEDLDPGRSGAVTLALPPGQYLLICNETGHFAAGMWAALDVTK